jgi:hypothetical protein
MAFLFLLIIPALIALGFFLFTSNRFSWQEFLCHVLVQCAVAGASVALIYSANIGDTEILNGTVIKKQRKQVSCSHSYSCNCYESCSGSGSSTSCTQICSTCYEHSYDVDWKVLTDLGVSVNIDRIDRQGLREPPRFTSVVIGEPFSQSHSFNNYIKGAPDTLFRYQGLVEKYKDKIPLQKLNIYDYYKLDRLNVVGGEIQNTKEWNTQLSEMNRDLGKKKQVNIGTVIVFNEPHEYFYALEQSWLGGKKNDAIPVVGVDKDLNIQWVDVIGWVTDPIFKIRLRDDIMDIKVLDKNKILKALANNVDNYYHRKSMKDFEYLKSSITPSTTQFVIALIIGILCSIGVGFFIRSQNLTDGWGISSRRV